MPYFVISASKGALQEILTPQPSVCTTGGYITRGGPGTVYETIPDKGPVPH